MTDFYVDFTDFALDDISKTSEWYNKWLPELNDKFITRLDQAIHLIATNPSAHPLVKKGSQTRKRKVHGFPYKIYYSIVGEVIVITGIIHIKRSNGYINGRLRLE